jgi:hypothetical protein
VGILRYVSLAFSMLVLPSVSCFECRLLRCGLLGSRDWKVVAVSNEMYFRDLFDVWMLAVGFPVGRQTKHVKNNQAADIHM